MRAKFALAALAGLLLQAGLAASPALAGSGANWGRQDTISIELRTEGWVETQTAKVMALLDISLKPEEAGMARIEVQKALDELAPKADWHITGFNRNEGASGLEQWQVTAEARMPESDLGGLRETARGLSQPGRQVRILGIDFSPTLAEQEATLTALREDIYRQAQAELERVRALWPDRDYRIHVIDLVPGGMTPPQPAPKMMRAEASMAYDSSAGGGDGFSASRKLTVYAVVSLAVRNSDK
jgi:hypothetical protein